MTQKLNVEPTGNLTAGGSATVSITDGPPNTTVTVNIDNGGELTDTVDVDLDANGNGSSPWSVPATGWECAFFRIGDCEVDRVIVST